MDKPAKSGFDENRLAAVPGAMQGVVDAGDLSGMVTLVWRDGEEVQLNAIGKRDIREMMMLDREFHQLLGDASRNRELAEVLRKLNERSLRFWFISFTTPDHHHSFQRQHEGVFDAIRRRDADAAEGAMREHIEAFRKSVARHL